MTLWRVELLLLLLVVPGSDHVGEVLSPVLTGSVVCSEEEMLLVDRELKLKLGLLELRIVRSVLISSLMLDDKHPELSVP